MSKRNIQVAPPGVERGAYLPPIYLTDAAERVRPTRRRVVDLEVRFDFSRLM